MKRLLLYGTAFVFFSACNQNGDGNETEKVYGAPVALVSSEPNNETTIKGPLSYGPDIPKLQEGDTIDVKFDVKHQLFKVSNTVAFTAWMFGDAVPGPILRVRVGQTIRFSMTDRSNDSMQNMAMHVNMVPMQHSIDFHSAMVNPEDKYRSIQPGETIHFTWTANYPGVFMYHCGTPMVLMHMIYGMNGMVIVEPREGYPGKVDREFGIVQNEYYFKHEGNVYIPDTTLALKKTPSYVAFNGKVGQYVVNPLKAKAGERVRLYLLNVGPNNASSFHVIGTILDKVWIDGNPRNELVGLQSVYLGPASGAVVEFVLPEKGSYTFVDHSFADATMGAIGVIKAE